MPENVRLSSTLGTSLDSVFVDRGQLEQVIMNLAVNARDAMPSGGSLLIETWNAMLDETYVAMHPGGTTGPHVVLSVRDTGIGMDAKTRDRIFEPFFTTKAPGQGTGLGLATVYGMVRQSGGSIYVYSEPDQGTTFKVYFPARVGVEDRADAPDEPMTAALHKLTVLLVEDDPAVREATKLVLGRLGHAVIPAPDAATALGLIRGSVELFDVVLTDAVMPGPSGLDLAEILRGERPDLPVILMSGYAEEAIDYDETRMQGVVFIEKPFTASIIAKALADAVAGLTSTSRA
jgi:two-component system, cell cycle sensor histidine kinase and response regulator CckA